MYGRIITLVKKMNYDRFTVLYCHFSVKILMWKSLF